MKPTQRHGILVLALLVAVACASTRDQESSRFYAAWQSFNDAQATWNALLETDNQRIREGEDPLFSERTRQVALLITREAQATFRETEPLLGDDSHRSEVMLAIGKINTLAFQLAVVYQGQGASTPAERRDS